jgi:hypothetical protein
MNPDDLIIIDYPPLLTSFSPTPNPPLYTDDYFIKLNQAWEKEVKYRNDVIDWLMEMERKYEKIWQAQLGVKRNRGMGIMMKPDIQPIQAYHKV